ncbi:MAG: hypothetical protein ACRDTG_07115 [Pseudonocardiaceae bacterium]
MLLAQCVDHLAAEYLTLADVGRVTVTIEGQPSRGNQQNDRGSGKIVALAGSALPGYARNVGRGISVSPAAVLNSSGGLATSFTFYARAISFASQVVR